MNASAFKSQAFTKMAALTKTMSAVALVALLTLAQAGPAAGGAATAPAPAEAAAPAQKDFGVWLADFRREAAQRGISLATLDLTLTGIEPVQRVLERDRSQAEFKLTFKEYSSRVITAETVERGRAMVRRHGQLLEQVSRHYGVQPRFIMGIWGIETRFGQVKGTMPVFPALATLAYDARRPAFFRNELIAALTMVERRYIDAGSMLGSWAGAMGQPQFIPSSYLAYAQDFDGDGRRDIWSHEGDILASIANYLSKHGWSTAETWGREVRLSASARAKVATLARSGRSGCGAIDQMTVDQPLAAWQAMGVRRGDGGDLPDRPLSASLVRVDGEEGDTFLVYRNYQSILRYNCAHLYGLTVGLLSDRISDR